MSENFFYSDVSYQADNKSCIHMEMFCVCKQGIVASKKQWQSTFEKTKYISGF